MVVSVTALRGIRLHQSIRSPSPRFRTEGQTSKVFSSVWRCSRHLPISGTVELIGVAREFARPSAGASADCRGSCAKNSRSVASDFSQSKQTLGTHLSLRSAAACFVFKMEALRRCSGVLFLALLFAPLIAASSLQADAAVVFVDSSVRPEYLRRTSATAKEVFSCDDVAASLAVLLGVVPGVVIDEKVAAKVDSVVAPNPFQRPRAVLSLNIGGVESDLIDNVDSLGLKFYQQRAFMAKDSHVSQISGDGLNVFTLTNLDAVDLHAEISEQDFQGESLFMSPSYKLDGDSKTVTAVSWFMSNGETFSLDVTKTADRVFFKELMGIFRNVQRAVSSQQSVDLEQPANLYFGNFNGIEELRQAYGSGHQTQLASKFVLYAVNQAVQYLQDNYNDKLVGVFTFTQISNDFEITVSERRVRFLQGADAAVAVPTPSAGNETLPEQMALHLGNQAVVFFTVLILLLALLLSTCCMFTMPLTRDSLLYSGLKLD